MAILSFEDISLAFGHWSLLDHAQFSLELGDRVGLIGRNGAGKSSLLKLCIGHQAPDDGKIVRASGLRMAYVAQEPVLDPEQTVFQAVSEGLGELKTVLQRYHDLAGRVMSADGSQPDGDDDLLEQLHEAQAELESHDGWRFNSRVDSVISRLDLQADQRISDLSGGWRKRVALGQALVAEPDVLLLDEPTNHLDLPAIIWLEGLLTQFAGAVLLITHDRRFLDQVCTRILELDRGRLRSYPGNFSAYVTLKERQLADEAVEQRKQDRLLAQEEIWIRKGVEARRTRAEGRIKRLEALRSERAARRERLGSVQFQLAEGERSGQLVAELEHVSKGYPGKPLIHDFSTRVMRGDRIGLVGPNGAGKSTLLKLILGELEPDAGTVRRGTKLNIAYFDQFRDQLDPEMTVVDTISQGNEFVEVAGVRKHVMSYLGDFLFAPQRAKSPVKSLSGGERNRLLLARLFTKPANVLVLDEPTNDLDIETLDLLEDLLCDFSGTVFLVSHDRTFLDNVATQWWLFEGQGHILESVTGLDDWLSRTSARKPGEARTATRELAAPAAPLAAPSAPRAVGPKLSYKEQRDLEELPGRIADLEREQAELQAQLLDPSNYVDQPDLAHAWQARVEQIEDELLTCLSRWDALESRAKPR